MSSGIALPLRRDGEAKGAVGELDLRDRPRAAAGADELADQGRRAGPFHLEPRWRRLSAALDNEIPSAQQRVGCGARLCERSRIPTAASTTAATPPNVTRAIMRPPSVRFCVPGACYDKRLPTLEQEVVRREAEPHSRAPGDDARSVGDALPPNSWIMAPTCWGLVPRSRTTTSSDRSAKAEWARCIARVIRGSIARSRSRFCPTPSQPIRTA